jgi:hypothetical protein
MIMRKFNFQIKIGLLVIVMRQVWFFYLHQYVPKETRDNKILDLGLTSGEAMVENLNVIDHLGNRYHSIVTWRLTCKVQVGNNQLPEVVNRFSENSDHMLRRINL